MLNKQQSIFLDIVQSFITKQNPTLRGAIWPELYSIARKQALSGLLGYYLGRNPDERCPDNLASQLKNDYYRNIAQAVLQENACESLTGILNSNGIEHLYFKGTVIRSFYPIPDLRSIGNIDVLVKPESVSRVCKLLKNENFELKQYSSKICSASKNTVVFIIHPYLSIPVKEDNSLLQDTNFQNASIKNESLFVLDHSYHLVYIIGNIARYITAKRCSIRPVCDVAVFSRANMDKIDWERVKHLLKECGLWDFALVVFACCTECFYQPQYFPDTKTISTDIVYEFVAFLLRNGAPENLYQNTQNRFLNIFSKKNPQDKNPIEFYKKIGL